MHIFLVGLGVLLVGVGLGIFFVALALAVAILGSGGPHRPDRR